MVILHNKMRSHNTRLRLLAFLPNKINSQSNMNLITKELIGGAKAEGYIYFIDKAKNYEDSNYYN